MRRISRCTQPPIPRNSQVGTSTGGSGNFTLFWRGIIISLETPSLCLIRGLTRRAGDEKCPVIDSRLAQGSFQLVLIFEIHISLRRGNYLAAAGTTLGSQSDFQSFMTSGLLAEFGSLCIPLGPVDLSRFFFRFFPAKFCPFNRYQSFYRSFVDLSRRASRRIIETSI